MGVVRPPWISEGWFSRYTFNYCDHFGNKKVLSKICKICAEDEKRVERYKRLGKDPYDLGSVLKETAINFAKIRTMLERDTDKFGIDLNETADFKDETPNSESYPIYRLVQKYSKYIHKLITILSPVIQKHKIKLLFMVNDVLQHSQLYVVVKIDRALSSRYEEEKDPFIREAEDAKTSAFLAYLAIQRNAMALLSFSFFLKSVGVNDVELRGTFLELADISQELAELVRQYFFPNYTLDYEEYGCEEYNATFAAVQENVKVIN